MTIWFCQDNEKIDGRHDLYNSDFMVNADSKHCTFHNICQYLQHAIRFHNREPALAFISLVFNNIGHTDFSFNDLLSKKSIKNKVTH